ncbi:MAG: DUF4278 domain-containing protein [Tildeniella nuda ZEHNDER 1965/U140]|jgi:hypothetical protein|nr:DUF4278 domain-containing protein [Tildeniella nuda ZEHNDER 1965/U140]
MQLTYRGTQYNYNPRSAEAVHEATVFRAVRPTFNLHYRGSVYTVDPNVELHLPMVKPTAPLVYRGSTYALNGWTEPAAVTQRAAISSGTHSFNKKVSGSAESSAIHRSNLQGNVQRRLQVAREQGDQDLINLLERELQQLA